MKMLLPFVMSILSPQALAAAGACLPVSGDRIVGGDLALIDARFAALPTSLTVASAPLPGARRTFAIVELTRIARAHGIVLNDPVEGCFEIPLRQLDRDEMLQEMRRSLPAAELAVVETSKTLVPSGKLEFPLAGLGPASKAAPEVRLWHGYVRYSNTRRMPVWARVSISQALTAVVAGKDLVANVPIEPDALRIEKRNGTAVTQHVALRVEDVMGRIPKKTVRAGDLIPVSVLERAPDIHRGDAVQVQVLSGSARLHLSAIAERDARSGEVIELRNPSSGKTFRARIDGPRAVVVVSAGPGL